MPGSDQQQHARRAGRGATALFPVAQGLDADAEQRGKPILRQLVAFADASDIQRLACQGSGFLLGYSFRVR
jgi:hypothetical protein